MDAKEFLAPSKTKILFWLPGLISSLVFFGALISDTSNDFLIIFPLLVIITFYVTIGLGGLGLSLALAYVVEPLGASFLNITVFLSMLITTYLSSIVLVQLASLKNHYFRNYYLPAFSFVPLIFAYFYATGIF